MAEGAVAQDLIIRLTADASQLMSTLKQAQKEIDGFGKAGAGGISVSGLKAQFGQINQYYKLLGDSSGAVKEKMSLLSGSMRDLVKSGQGNSDMAQRLAGVYKNLKSQASGASDGLKGIASNLASRVVPGFSEVKGAVGSLSAAFPQLAAAAGPVGIAVAAIVAAYKAVIIPGMQFNAMLEQQSVAFTSMLKSGDKATAMLDELKALSLTTPIGLGEGAASAKQMLAYGFAQSEIVDNLKLMKTVAGAVNVSLSDLTYVYGTLRAQGRAYTRDLMQFGMRGIPIYEYLATTLGVSVEQIKGMTEAGSIGFKEVEAAMKAMVGEGGKFNGMLEKSMQTTEGLKTQISNTWQMFTGEASTGTSAIFKSVLVDVLSVVRGLQELAPSFNAIFSTLSFILGVIVKGWIFQIQVTMALWKLIQNIVLSLIDGVVWLAKWIDNALGISEAFNNAGSAINSAGSKFNVWLHETIPLLTQIEIKCKEIGSAIEAWWNRGKKPKEPILDMVVGEIDQYIKDSPRLLKEIDRFVAQARRSGGNIPASDIGKWAREMDVPVESIYRAMAKWLPMSQKTFDDYVRNTKTAMALNRDYWLVYADDIDNVLTKKFLATGTSAATALVKVEDNLRNTFQYQEGLDMAKLLGFDDKETKDSLTKSAGEIADTLYKQIAAMRNLQIYKTGEGKTFFDGLIAMWKKYSAEAEKEGKGAKRKTDTAFDDLLQQYLEFRAEWATSESGFNEALVSALNSKLDPLNYTTGIMGDLSMLDRQLALIDQKYDKIAANMSQEEWNVIGQAVQQMREMEKAAARLNNELEQIQGNLEINMDPTKTIDLLKKQYDIEVEISKLKTLTDKERLDNIKKQIELEQKIVDIALQGDQEAYKRANNQMIAQGQQSGDYQQVAGGIAGNAIAGTDIGKLIGGADPITMLISSFIEMMMSIENVSKVLNFFGTIMDGIKSMIEGPTNEALKNVVLLLTKVGEAVGAILVPFIEVFGDFLDRLAVPLVLVAEMLKRFFVALKPLIKIILYLNNPLAWIGRLFGQLADALGSFLKTEEDHQKDLESLYDKELATLQNLYEVGALSGAEYEARLAELRARYATNTDTEADPALVALLTDIFDALDAMGESLNELFVALTPLIDAVVAVMVPFLKPVLDLLIRLLGGFFKDVATIVTVISNLVTSLLKGDWSKAGEYLAAAFKAVAGFFINPLLRIFNWISTLIADVGNWLVIGSDPFKAFTIPELAVGSGNIPSNMLSMLHQGEAVVPKTFMDAIRSGELALTGAGAGGGGTIVVNVYNEGSVIAERDLNRSIYDGITTLKKKGYV